MDSLWLRVLAINVYGILGVSSLLSLRPIGFLYLMGVVLFWPQKERRAQA